MARWLWIVLVVLVLDQSSKLAAEHFLTLHQPLPLLPYFNLTLVYNPGAAFSFLSEAGGWQRGFFIAVGLIASTVIFFWLRRLGPGEGLSGWSLSLILGGALGNVIDRVWHGSVIDFLDVYYENWHWPAFNIADSAISVGVVLLIFGGLLSGNRAER